MVNRKQGGILIVSSGVGLMSVPYMSTLSASKAYAVHLGVSFHHELKPKGVDVTVVSPGRKQAEMTRHMLPRILTR